MVPLISTSQGNFVFIMAPSENPCFFINPCFLWLLLGGLCCFLVVVVVVVGLVHLLLRALIIMVKLELAMSVHKLNIYTGKPVVVVVVVVVVAQTLNPQACT
jgi:hypothetical protein